jgi:hypothetical protein
MRTILVSVCLFIALFATAQRECATVSYLQEQLQADPSLQSRIAAVEDFIYQRSPDIPASANGRTGGVSVIRIPVVVHVLYNSPAQNISDAQIKSQIDALNRDFRRNNPDSINTPQRFKSLAADTEIEFVLATADPSGRATTGIIRKQTSVKDWSMDDKIKFNAQGGDNAWDSRYYLNIWVGNMRTLGYSSTPGAAADKDGVVITYTAFGTINTSAPYNMGRTAVHEVGHWLGLKHIWGDTYCGDDMVDDTPRQGNFTPGCPSGFRSSCSNGTVGDMYMNYMDYTSDACINLFTNGQKSRMRSLFLPGGPRASLLQSKGLSEPWNSFEEPATSEEAPVAESKVKIYPNPAQSDITLDFGADQTWTGKELLIINTSGIAVQKLTITRGIQKVNIGQLKPGIYFVQGINGDVRMRMKIVKM